MASKVCLILIILAVFISQVTAYIEDDLEDLGEPLRIKLKEDEDKLIEVIKTMQIFNQRVIDEINAVQRFEDSVSIFESKPCAKSLINEINKIKNEKIPDLLECAVSPFSVKEAEDTLADVRKAQKQAETIGPLSVLKLVHLSSFERDFRRVVMSCADLLEQLMFTCAFKEVSFATLAARIVECSIETL